MKVVASGFILAIGLIACMGSGDAMCGAPHLAVVPQQPAPGQLLKVRVEGPLACGGFESNGLDSLKEVHVSLSPWIDQKRTEIPLPSDASVQIATTPAEPSGSFEFTVRLPEDTAPGRYFLFLKELHTARSDMITVG